ncbi:flavin reductase family protein [Pseudomonas fluorescens]|uniref:flavin reductase family protein n=1 Tax=Pseudomonas fluorescens TaxID=294 RepID=UPI000F06953C|nr:flavin reductase family protein [Pseudomonas fluorescens]VVO24342.1 FMN reductase (NADH) RutF [Pseudomonas fluorescens]
MGPSDGHHQSRFKRYGAVCVNILCGEHQEMSGAFANRALTMDERVAVTQWTTLESGAPVMIDALVNVDCRITQVHEVGSHAYHRLGEASKAC